MKLYRNGTQKWIKSIIDENRPVTWPKNGMKQNIYRKQQQQQRQTTELNNWISEEKKNERRMEKKSETYIPFSHLELDVEVGAHIL